MKSVVAMSFAAMFAMGVATGANAVPQSVPVEADYPAVLVESPDVAWDHCHGRMSGTSHALCGTATGGPVGGLF